MFNISIVTNIPTPYKNDLIKELSKFFLIKVFYGRKTATDRNRNWVKENKDFYKVFLFTIYYRKEDFIVLNPFQLFLNKTDLVLFGGYSNLGYLSLIFISIFLRKSFGLLIDGKTIRNNSRIITFIKKLIFSKAKLIIYSSDQSIPNNFLLNIKPNKLFKIETSSVQKKDLITVSDLKFISKRKSKKIGFVGQFIFRKGIDILINAFREIPNNNHYELHLVGGEESFLPKELRQKINKQIFIRGFLNKDDLLQFYKEIDILVVPSREEVWGLVIIEAMSQGLLILASSEVTSAIDLLPYKNYQLFISENIIDLKNKLVKLINASIKYKIRKRNLDKVRKITVSSQSKKMGKAIISVINKTMVTK
jgi:glycosyltransferase involved in cell wall biosynthesis